MKHFIFAVILMVATLELRAQTGLSSLLVTNINALDFKVNISPTNAVTNIVKMNLSRSQFQAPVVPGDVWTLTNISGVYGGSTNIFTNSIWGIDGSGHITPVVTNSAVIATNIVRDGHGVNTGSETWQTKSIVLTNGVNYLPVADWSQLQLISPSSDPSLVQIVLSNGWNTVQHLEIFNLTNAVPSQGAFTLTNLTPIPDSLGGGVVKLINNENWVATNGCGIELRFISPDWVEQFRSDVSGNPTFISNTFNNITVISNTTLRGRITINNVSITTNTLWTTNVVAGVVNLQPVDLTEQPMVKNGWFVGTNSQTLWGSALGSDWALVSVADATKGEGGRGLSIASTDGNFSTNYSQITLSTVTNTAGLTLLSSDGSNDSVVSLQSQQATGGGGVLDIKFGGTNFVHIEPGITNGSPIAQFGSSITHSTGNLFELANNTTNRVVVTPLSTLIGSPVTSPNFSVPAALEVSNFQDRGKALTVDIKLGASGNNDDYPVYFYSQITNSSAHPTINMEEVSPSGYIGGAHTLLSVQETPKVTNTVSTWPTYAAASTTAGYFNAAPTGGTNGAAMGLQGSVDPTRNFINIGVGSYVEATTDNLAATNIAFSGTVNQVLGTQKAVGGLFEIGSLANIPSIPSSAGVLIDGHNSGAPLIIAQTNGAVQFKVAANSGYAGSGTTFLADDGTYKAAGGGGGSALWYSYTSTDAEGGTVYGTASTNHITNIIDFTTGYLTNLFGYRASQIKLGIQTTTLQSVAATNGPYVSIGDTAGDGQSLHNTSDVNNFGEAAGGGQLLTNVGDVYNIGDNAGWNQVVHNATNGGDIYNYGTYSGDSQVIVDSFEVFNFMPQAGAIQHVSRSGSGEDLSVVNFGNRAGNSQQVDTCTNIYNFGWHSSYSAQYTNDNNIYMFGDAVMSGGAVTASYDIFGYGVNVLQSCSISNAHSIFALGDGAGGTGSGSNFSAQNNTYDVFLFGDWAGNGLNLNNSSDIFSFGPSAGVLSFMTNCVSIMSFGGLSSAVLNDSTDVVTIGPNAGNGIQGAYTNIVLIGDGSTIGATGENQVILGTNMFLNAPGGFASGATSTGAISSTGWTNSLAVDADVAFDATTLVYKLSDASGAFWYTNSVAVGQGFVHLQPGGKFVLVSGTGLSGRYHAH